MGTSELREALVEVLRLYGIRGEQLGSLRPGSVADALIPVFTAHVRDARGALTAAELVGTARDLRDEFLDDLAACVGQNSLTSFAMDLDRLLSAHVAAELRRVADEIDQDGDAATLMEYDELAGGHHRSAQSLRIRAEQMEPHQ